VRLPLRDELKTSRLPSGDHTGSMSPEYPSVTGAEIRVSGQLVNGPCGRPRIADANRRCAAGCESRGASASLLVPRNRPPFGASGKSPSRTYHAMQRNARAGHVTGGRLFGDDNVDITDVDGWRSHVERRINDHRNL
jgi:hypothetical protein